MHQPIDKGRLCYRAYIMGYHEAKVAEQEARAVEVPVLHDQDVAEAFADGVLHYSMERCLSTGRLVTYHGNA